MQPRLSNPLRSGGRTPAWYWAAGIAVLGGLVAAAMVAPLAGLAVGAVLLLGLLLDRVRVILVLGALGLIILTDVVMARGQSLHRFVPDINWPAHFPVANSFTWLAICLLAADAIVVAVRVRSSSGRADEDDGPPPEPAQDEGPARPAKRAPRRPPRRGPDYARGRPRGRYRGGRPGGGRRRRPPSRRPQKRPLQPTTATAAGSDGSGVLGGRDRRHQAMEFLRRRAGFSTMK